MTTVLIADDNAQIVSILRNTAEGGYLSLTAADGEQALQLFRQEAPDAKQVGCNDARWMALPNTPSDTPVIMVSAREWTLNASWA